MKPSQIFNQIDNFANPILNKVEAFYTSHPYWFILIVLFVIAMLYIVHCVRNAVHIDDWIDTDKIDEIQCSYCGEKGTNESQEHNCTYSKLTDNE